MRCNGCDTARAYNLIHSWWLQTGDSEHFEHPCPFCGATLYIHLEVNVMFTVTTFRESQYLPPKPD
jgi:hypothetical protein